MKEQILAISKIANPVRILTVDDWKDIAKKILKESDKEWTYLTADLKSIRIERKALVLLSRFESLTRGKMVECEHCLGRGEIRNEIGDPVRCKNCNGGKVFQPALLTKEMFVCDDGQDDFAFDQFSREKFSAAQKKVWFKGFEQMNKSEVRNEQAGVSIWFPSPLMQMRDNRVQVLLDTPYDLIYHITKYNETPSTKIHLEYSEYFLTELIKD